MPIKKGRHLLQSENQEVSANFNGEPPGAPSYLREIMFRSVLQKELQNGLKKKSSRSLRFESLECRELLSVSAVSIPQPDFTPSDSAYIDTQNTAVPNTPAPSVSGQSDSTQTFAPLAATATLSPPKKVPTIIARTTLEVHWTAPAKSDNITNYLVNLLDSKTKAVLKTETVSSSSSSVLFDGLDFKKSYKIQIFSCGSGGEKSKAIEFSATTADFKPATVKASDLKISSATLTITDKDTITPFVNNQTVKTYTIQYVEKVTSKPDWTQATDVIVAPGTAVLDAAKGTIAVPVTGLIPGKQYFVRIQSDLTDNGTNIHVDGRQTTFKTIAFPATTISKTFFSVDNSYHLTVGLNGKIANMTKIVPAGTTASFALLVSTATTIDKATGKVTGAQPVSVPIIFSTPNDKGEFSMTPVDFESIATTLGANNLLASKTVTFQLEVTFSGVTTTAYSKTGKATMPAWYKPS